MGRFELNSDCHVTALQAQSKLVISSSYEVHFCSMSTCWKDNFNTFPMDPARGVFFLCPIWFRRERRSTWDSARVLSLSDLVSSTWEIKASTQGNQGSDRIGGLAKLEGFAFAYVLCSEAVLHSKSIGMSSVALLRSLLRRIPGPVRPLPRTGPAAVHGAPPPAPPASRRFMSTAESQVRTSSVLPIQRLYQYIYGG